MCRDNIISPRALIVLAIHFSVQLSVLSSRQVCLRGRTKTLAFQCQSRYRFVRKIVGESLDYITTNADRYNLYLCPSIVVQLAFELV